jgi:hypothetical protein
LIALGTASALTYHVHKALFFAARRFDFGYPKALGDLADRGLPLVAAVLVLAGATLPTWGPRLGVPALWGWFRDYRTYLGLRPLWLALYRANPQIALVPPLPFVLDVVSLRDLDMRLYRRVIEIRDGRLALQPYLVPGVVGTSGRAQDAVAEAATLDAAVRARASGSAPVTSTHAVAVPGGHDLESDIAFLTEVAKAYRRLRRRRSARAREAV